MKSVRTKKTKKAMAHGLRSKARKSRSKARRTRTKARRTRTRKGGCWCCSDTSRPNQLAEEWRYRSRAGTRYAQEALDTRRSDLTRKAGILLGESAELKELADEFVEEYRTCKKEGKDTARIDIIHRRGRLLDERIRRTIVQLEEEMHGFHAEDVMNWEALPDRPPDLRIRRPDRRKLRNWKSSSIADDDEPDGCTGAGCAVSGGR